MSRPLGSPDRVHRSEGLTANTRRRLRLLKCQVTRYQHVVWTHDFHDEPVSLWSGLDDHGMEMRKVEVFRDGRPRRAPPSARDAGTRLGELPVPPIDEINRDPQFRARLVDEAAFEIEWSTSEFRINE